MPVWDSERTVLSTDSSRARETPGLSGDQYAFQLGATHNTEKWRLGAGYAEVGDNFNPEVGFLARDNGFRKAEFSVNRNIRLAARQLLEVPRASAARELRRVLELRRCSGDGPRSTRSALAIREQATSFTPA